MRPHSARLPGWLFLGFVIVGCAQAGARPATVLPLTTLRLYETGVGYFERSGTLSPEDRTALPVPASHLDDALASLVVLTADHDAHDDRVRGVSFDSRPSGGMARALAGLPAQADAPIAYRDLLASLKGAHVEVRTTASGATPLTGRVIEVEGTAEPDLHLVVLGDRSDIVRVPVAAIASIRPTDPAYASRLGTALDALGAHATTSRRLLDLLGGSHGPVTLGYVAEAPVWRTTYRIVLGDGAAGTAPSTLQGWALVHNDTDEDWRGVKLELVNGRPDSFLFPLAAPRYGRRALAHPDDRLSTVPQLLTTTADGIWGDNIDDAAGGGGLGLSDVGEGGGGYGEGIGLGSIRGTIGHGSASGWSSMLTVGDLARTAPAAGTEAGALFVYTLPDRLELRAHASALLPFVDQPIGADPIAWVERAGEPAQAAVRFVDTTRQTLPAGTVTFFSAGGFAGESGLDRLKPGERRFVRFGADLDVEVSVTQPRGTPVRDAVERLTYAPGELTEHYLRTSEADYTFGNRGGTPRAICLALHIGRNAKVTGADEVDFDAATSTPMAVMHVGPRATVARSITTVEGLSRETAVEDLSSDRLATLTASPELADADKAIALEALTRLRQLEDTRRAKLRAAGDLDSIEKELGRLREDMKALGGDRGGAAPPEFVKRLLSAEERHGALRTEGERLEAEEKTRDEAVRASLARLSPGGA